MKEISKPYEGPLDPPDRLALLLANHRSDETACNAIRIAFQIGRDEGHLEARAAEYETNQP